MSTNNSLATDLTLIIEWHNLGLSWGLVQAETVRLQKQIEPGLMDTHLKYTEFCCKEEINKFYTQQSLDARYLETKQSKSEFWYLLVQRKFMVKKSQWQKTLGFLKLLGLNSVSFLPNYVYRFSLHYKIIYSKIFGPNLFWSKIFFFSKTF